MGWEIIERWFFSLLNFMLYTTIKNYIKSKETEEEAQALKNAYALIDDLKDDLKDSSHFKFTSPNTCVLGGFRIEITETNPSGFNVQYEFDGESQAGDLPRYVEIAAVLLLYLPKAINEEEAVRMKDSIPQSTITRALKIEKLQLASGVFTVPKAMPEPVPGTDLDTLSTWYSSIPVLLLEGPNPTITTYVEGEKNGIKKTGIGVASKWETDATFKSYERAILHLKSQY